MAVIRKEAPKKIDAEELALILKGNETLEPTRVVFIPCKLADCIGVQYKPEDVPNPEPKTEPDHIKKAKDEGLEVVVVPPGIYVEAEVLCDCLRAKLKQMKPKEKPEPKEK